MFDAGHRLDGVVVVLREVAKRLGLPTRSPAVAGRPASSTLYAEMALALTRAPAALRWSSDAVDGRIGTQR
jgi:hypothetical protein